MSMLDDIVAAAESIRSAKADLARSLATEAAPLEPAHDMVDDYRLELERKIRQAYGTALQHSHEGGSVQIHAGTAIVDYFKAKAEHPRHPLLNGLIVPRMFGYPLVPVEHDDPGHISVHVVHYVS